MGTPEARQVHMIVHSEGNLMFPTLQSTALWVPITLWSITPVKAAGLGPTKMRKGSWNAKVVHLVAILSIYTLGASLNAKVRTLSFSVTSECLVASFWSPWWDYWN